MDEELLDILTACPPPLPPKPPTAYDVTLALPDDWAAGNLVELQIRPGVINAPGGGLCATVSGRTMREDVWSVVPSVYSPDDCVRISEPNFEASLAVAVIAIFAVSTIRNWGK